MIINPYLVQPSGPSYGTLTTAWIAATGETDLTILGALNTLESDLTTYGLTSKMKALYPFVGGTAAKHKYNFMNAQDSDAAFRLVFNGGWTHSSTGALPNGTNAYADTKLTASISLTISSGHLSIYSRSNISEAKYDFAATNNVDTENSIVSRSADNKFYFSYGTASPYPSVANADSRGHFLTNRNSVTNTTSFKNGTKVYDAAQTSTSLSNFPFYIAALNNSNFPSLFSSKQSAFASIGDGLTDTEAANFYTAVQTFQTTLGRQVGVPIVSDSDAQEFLNAAVITDTTQASAINTLVTGLKADGIWTKMKALYPFVGGTATSHKYNLKNPLDTDAAFRLVFSGGGTHSINGYLTNGVNAFAETYYNPFNNLTDINSNHISIYSRTNNQGGIDMGGGSGSVLVDLELKYSATSYNWNMAANFSHTNADSTGFYINTRTASNAFKLLKNGSTVLGSSTGAAGATKPNITYHIGKRNYDPLWTNREYAFASIGDGLNDTEATNFYTAVQAFQTTLSRNV